jgi:glucokinase
MALSSPFMDDYRQCGCFESFASGSGLGAQIQKAVKEHPEYTGVLSGKPVKELSSYDVFEHYDSDPLARSVLDKAIEMWGMGAANIVSLLNPEIVVFGGGIFGPAARFLDRIREEALKWGQPIAMRSVRFAVSELPGEAALYGAARLVIRDSLDK